MIWFLEIFIKIVITIPFTSRVIAFQDEILNADIKKKIFKHFYMVDSLYLAFKDRAKEQKNIEISSI